MTTSLSEQETTIVLERSQEQARIYSNNPTFHTKMARAGHNPYKVWGDGLFYLIPKSCISIRAIPKPMTKEARERMAARLRDNVGRAEKHREDGKP